MRASRPTDRPLDLREADLVGGQFAAAKLRDADLRRANLQQADLRGANLAGARLNWADLTQATLVAANLQNADLSAADLAGADLRDADLRGALLDGANLSHARVAGARGLPDELAFVDGVVPGPGLQGHPAESQQGLAAFEQGRSLHAAGRLAAAQRAYLLARAWQPESDIVPYALACLAFDRDDATTAQLWLEETLRVDADADRARLELGLLLLAWQRDADARAVLQPVADRFPTSDADALRARIGETALTAWLDRRPVDRPTQPQPHTLHDAIQHAIANGRTAQASRRWVGGHGDDPLAALWRLLLPKLAATAEAFDALLVTRAPALGPRSELCWHALGAHATTARLTTPQGTYWAQRVVGALRPEAALRWTAALLTRLAAEGFAVPAWQRDAANQPYLAFDGDWLLLSADLPGAPLPSTLDAAALAGRTLATVHLATRALDADGPRPVGGLQVGTALLERPSPGAAWLEALAGDPALVGALAHESMHTRIAPLLDLVARRLRPVLADCPRGLCHGDFAPQNLLLQDDGTLAVLDWDLADVQPLVWDLARTLDLFAVRWPPRAGDPPEIDWPRLRALRAGYEAVRPLNAAERVALPLLIAASRLDLDAGALALLAPLDPDVIAAILPPLHARLARAAAGVPELQELA